MQRLAGCCDQRQRLVGGPGALGRENLENHKSLAPSARRGSDATPTCDSLILDTLLRSASNHPICEVESSVPTGWADFKASLTTQEVLLACARLWGPWLWQPPPLCQAVRVGVAVCASRRVTKVATRTWHEASVAWMWPPQPHHHRPQTQCPACYQAV